MTYIQATNNRRERYLISGFPNTGKTHCLPTFIYGPYDRWSDDPTEQQDAVTYASDKHMVIIVAPGEFGVRSLPPPCDNITCYYNETSDKTNIQDASWSEEAIRSFNAICTEIIKQKPDVLAIDGLHSLWLHLMNRTTNGDFLQGETLDVNPETNRVDKYRAARFYSQTHNAFGQYLAGLYDCHIPLIVCTTWEEWESGQTENQRPGDIASTRYLWPAIPGQMARGIVGRFDARLSARLEKTCFHNNCEDANNKELHHVWQILPKGDVMGVGIKGLRRTNAKLKRDPFVHQSYDVLQRLIGLTVGTT